MVDSFAGFVGFLEMGLDCDNRHIDLSAGHVDFHFL